MKKKLLILSFLIPGLGLLAQSPRLSLFEEFTGENCGPCAATNPSLNITLQNNASKVVAIKWQVPIPSAPSATWSLYKTNKAEIDWRYGLGYGYPSQWDPTDQISAGINSAPQGRLDGQHLWAFGAGTDHGGDATATVIATAQSYTSAFSITMNRAWNKTCTAVTLTISITATAPFTSVGPLVFRTVMVEEKIQFQTAPGSNGEKTFEDVAIKSFPSIQTGVAMANTWTVGQTQTFTLNCTLPSYTRKKDEVAFVGFIQDDGNRKVAQAARVGKQPIPQEAISALSSNVDLTCTNLITPTVEVKNEQSTNAITAFTLIPYIDGVAGTGTPWSGNLAPGATTIITLNPVTSPAISGSHSFSCDIDMPVPVYNMITNATRLNYMVGSTYQATPVAEGFTASVFPPAGFAAINKNNGPGWSRSLAAGAYNIAPLESTKYDFYTNTLVGDKDELYLPPMDLSGAPSPQLSFDMAYAQRDAGSDDALDVMVSDNCGQSWTSIYNAHGSTLATAPPNSSFAYVPDPSDANQWRTVTLDLTSYKQPDLLVKFVTTNDHGNNLYLDNINLALVVATGIKHSNAASLQMSLYPNPSNGIAQVSMNSIKAGNATISVVNTLGQVVYSKQIVLNQGSNLVQLDLKDQASGIYHVSIDTNSGTFVKKLSLTK